MNKLAVASFVGFFSFICWVIFMANTGQSSLFFDFVHWLPLGDKIGHAGLFGTLTLLANFGLGFRRVRGVLVGTAVIVLFVVVEELSQHFLPTRTFDFVDLLADAVGIFGATYMGLWLNQRATFKSMERFR